VSKLLKLAKACLVSGASVHSKKAFCSAYNCGVHEDPTLIERGVYDLIVRSFLEEDPLHSEVREKAAYAIEAVLNQRPEWADMRLAEAVRSPGHAHYWRTIIERVLTEKRPDLLPDPEPDVPGTPLPSLPAHSKVRPG
jgi:hypothetical protein